MKKYEVVEGKKRTTPEYMQKVREYNDKNYEKLTLMLSKGIKAEWKAEAKKKGMSLTRFVTEAVTQYIVSEGQAIPEEPDEN